MGSCMGHGETSKGHGMTTQQPEAIKLAERCEHGYPLTGDAISAAAELRRQHARITALESQLAQRFDAADMATAAAQGFRDGVAPVSAGSEPVATVFTMEALTPGGGVKYHATIHKALPAGTKLYTHPSPTEGMVMAPKVPTVEMKAAAVKYANGTAVYKNVKAEVLRIEEDIYGEVYEAMIAAATGPADGESNG